MGCKITIMDSVEWGEEKQRVGVCRELIFSVIDKIRNPYDRGRKVQNAKELREMC